MISRFRTKQEQKATVEAVANGRLDILVGTHRLLSQDVTFHDLGLLVVDEEQRFGVRAQGAAQAAAQEGGRADDDGHAHSAHAEHVACRHPRHVGDRDAAARPALHPDARRQVRPARHRRRHPQRAGARRAGVLRPQPRGVDPLDGQPAAAAGAGGAHRHRPRADARGRARTRDGGVRRPASTTSCWPRRSSRTGSTSRTRTPSSSTARTATASRSSTSCAGAWGGPTGGRTPTC